ncbi:MAG: methyltransferase domain-containing protein [Candidatus Omnitrophica bacterium]|nr:methyltransferase domain-containing protein [Candidatus Omnitrophota bacterium]
MGWCLTPFVDERLNQHLGKRVIDSAALQTAVADLEGYTRQKMQTVSQNYWDSPKSPETQDPAALLEFYRTSNRYVYESAYTEGYADHVRMKRMVVAAVRRWHLSPVLDFGGGGGGITLALAASGISCEYADVPGKLTEFVRWRLAQRRFSIPIHDATRPLPSKRYRAVLGIDVLEHVPDLAATLRQLKSALVPRLPDGQGGGWLIATHSFTDQDPLHLASSHVYGDLKKFDRLMQSEDFRYQGRLKPDLFSEQWYRIFRRPLVLGARLSPKLKGGGNLLVYRLS